MMDVGSLCEKYEILKHMASFVANMKCYESTLKGGMDHIVWIFFSIIVLVDPFIFGP